MQRKLQNILKSRSLGDISTELRVDASRPFFVGKLRDEGGNLGDVHVCFSD